MSHIYPADSNIVPRREFLRDQHPSSSFSILALSGPALLRLYSFPPDAVLALRKHLDNAHLIVSSRELIQNNFCELSLDGKPWSNPKSTRTEKLLIDILCVLYRIDYNFLSTLDYGREQDDRIVMAFARPSSSPPPPFPAATVTPFHKKSDDSLTEVPHPFKVPFAISFISQNVLRVIAPPLHLTPAILQTVRGSWPRGVVSEKKVADNVYEFKFKGYGWFQEDTFATDSLRHILSVLSSLDIFGFTLLTSLSLSGRSRVKDLWVFLGLSQANPNESRPNSPIDSKMAPSDRIRGRRGSYPAPANSPTSSNPRGHTRAASSNNIPSSGTGPRSSKSGVMRKPAPRAQLPVSVAHSTASHEHIPDAETPTTHADELRMELQSSVGSAVDMTGVGTHRYGRPGEPDDAIYQRMPSRLYGNLHLPGAPAPAVKVPQTGGPSRSAQPFGEATGRLDAQPTTREANLAPIPSGSRPSHRKSTSQSGIIPTPPLLGPGAFRNSANSSNSSQTVDVPIAWTGAGKESGHPRSRSRSRDPKENVLPGGWVSASTGIKQSKAPGDHPNPNESHRHRHALTPPSQLEEQEVKAGTPELVYPKLRPARSGKATIVTEGPRAEPHGAKFADRLPEPVTLTPGKRDHQPTKVPTEGWVLVNVGQPGMPTAPPAHLPSQNRLQRKQSFPPLSSQRPPVAHSPYSTGSRVVPTGLAVGSHKKAPSNYNPSSMSPAAKAIVVFDAIESKQQKATTGNAPQSSFRKFFSLSRPDTPPIKSPSNDRKLVLSGGGSRSKLLEQEDGTSRREGAPRRTRETPEGRKSHRRMSVD